MYSVVLTLGNGVVFTITFVDGSNMLSAWEVWAQYFDRSDEFDGLEREWLDKTFKAKNVRGVDEFKVVGLDRDRDTDPIVITFLQNGKSEVGFMPVKTLLLAAGKTPTAKSTPRTIADLRQAKPSADVLASQGEAKPAA